MAAPHVSGALALLLSRPGMTNARAVEILLGTANRSVRCGATCAGRLDAAAAVAATGGNPTPPPPPVAPAPPPPARPAPSTTSTTTASPAAPVAEAPPPPEPAGEPAPVEPAPVEGTSPALAASPGARGPDDDDVAVPGALAAVALVAAGAATAILGRRRRGLTGVG